MHSLLEVITTSKLNNSFPNVEIALEYFVFIHYTPALVGRDPSQF